tara:strand:+ start:5123 stop:5239 length:117 start_codon:yes stop_codon:yes gene_type:complete
MLLIYFVFGVLVVIVLVSFMARLVTDWSAENESGIEPN